jgi:hypothetical protein
MTAGDDRFGSETSAKQRVAGADRQPCTDLPHAPVTGPEALAILFLPGPAVVKPRERA